MWEGGGGRRERKVSLLQLSPVLLPFFPFPPRRCLILRLDPRVAGEQTLHLGESGEQKPLLLVYLWNTLFPSVVSVKNGNRSIMNHGPLYQNKASAHPLIWNWFCILMQMKPFSTRKVVHLAWFCKWGFLELVSGILIKICGAEGDVCFSSKYNKGQNYSISVPEGFQS